MYERCDVCGTMEGVVRNHMPGKKFACNKCFGDRYRRAAESAGRDGITVHVENSFSGPSIKAFFRSVHMDFRLWVDADPSPENWRDQAIQLVNRVHRLRELLRQAGEAI